MKQGLVFRVYKNDRIFSVKQFSQEDRVIIGNGPNVQIDLGAEVSDIHCLIEKRGEQFFIRDMGSGKGTFKNENQILDEPIQSGETFQVGPYNIIILTGAKKISSQPELVTLHSDRTLKKYLKAGQGQQVEVIICWQDTILNTYHFKVEGQKTLGVDGDISVPMGVVPEKLKFLNMESGVVLSIAPDMKIEVLRANEAYRISEMSYKLQQSEVCFIQMNNGMQLAVRFAPKTPVVTFDSALILGASELSGVLAALIISVFVSLLVSLNKIKPVKNTENIQRVAQVIFSPPPLIEEKKEGPVPVLLKDEKTESVAQKQPVKLVESVGRAVDIKPKNPQLKNKMFTSSKQAAAIKISESTAANAKSKELDPNNSGLLSAFGLGGARSQLDQAYSGAGQLIGDSEKAGASGFNNDRRGKDLGSKIKDTGAGGAGTATLGIGGLSTKGRGGGASKYGSGESLGTKGAVQISAGGSGETFVGSIDKEAVRRVVKSALPQFKACYEREYHKNTSLTGKLVIKWDIDDQGVAKNALVVKEATTINNQVVEECVRLRMLGLKFPESPAGTYAEISYPFLFDGPKF